ncbi:MAG: peptide deformylase, partial [Micromonosporaceae bacterium]
VGHVINPTLQSASALGGSRSDVEGCLSIPGAQARVPRDALATVTGFDRAGSPITVSGTGNLSRCLQHESDHLNGIVYLDRLPQQQRETILAAAGLDSDG